MFIGCLCGVGGGWACRSCGRVSKVCAVRLGVGAGRSGAGRVCEWPVLASICGAICTVGGAAVCGFGVWVAEDRLSVGLGGGQDEGLGCQGGWPRVRVRGVSEGVESRRRRVVVV